MKKLVFGFIATVLILSSLAVCGYYIGRNVLFRVAHTDVIQEVSKKYDVDPYLLMALVAKESAFNKEVMESYSPTETYNGAINLTDTAAQDWANKAGIILNKPADIADPKVSIELAGYILATAKQNVGNDTKKQIAEFLKRNDATKNNDTYVNEVASSILIYRLLYMNLD
ncbi:transglycosylase SLT domain-containing protein [Culicoidibacter larvae]|uniref:Lytic transglycosylase domain-containing protein n=1 Tax=Culicoidibacter larvae TaxID=2579976 RepID=A0A5R8QGI9_9FIRM|nr:transglycosylase SLT domain-containing protein [Culicoidibacter larvae]TLG76573.1 lytic transglycosylase domain-containing protein [Culicoidibacter larvae]